MPEGTGSVGPAKSAATDDIATAQNPEMFAETTATAPMGRVGQPTDLAETANFLCSPAARFITGLNMIVEGGESLR